mmetsp:Transcript_21456/g.59434  ORF Transcript_21456/g.59434 Transcript_21456/m.59434 type:complete len:83 (+) Transcript_21456:114-362(+)|eukprot:CAMPEP_0202366830 /NCGR_PEP_ID=MMETSP1126-20121109/17286_1 /ASSEMBLY_ACC=CAM_ASM_000457 /TAXON_ID=3047 /ORGANISM="Dunaliella tertiolecta, Strain CCMP1320" /LENGTH=82 /DNA_ID=CAMNT_0048961961 /DNA_START=28 /DNA_END=276 /DNA_ORIENTATION=+
MPRGVAKANLPQKVCVVCQRPFTWRKSWERCWNEVLTCSDRCKSVRKKEKSAENRKLKEGVVVVPPPDQKHESWRKEDEEDK